MHVAVASGPPGGEPEVVDCPRDVRYGGAGDSACLAVCGLDQMTDVPEQDGSELEVVVGSV